MTLELFFDIILPSALWLWGPLSFLQKWVSGIFPGGKRQPVPKADNVITFLFRFPWNLGVLSSWNPQSLYLTYFNICLIYWQTDLLFDWFTGDRIRVTCFPSDEPTLVFWIVYIHQKLKLSSTNGTEFNVIVLNQFILKFETFRTICSLS